jgi:Domain of unknown function (DUF1707)
MSDLPERPEHSLRIGNPERDAVVQRLTEALNEGRIELAEYDDRVQQVYAAKTQAELVPITVDLPAPPPPPAPKASLFSRVGQAERAWLSTAVLLTGIWLITVITDDRHSPHGFWPIWPLGFWGIALITRRIGGR